MIDIARAREEDICALRAFAAIEEVVREIALERETPLVDFATWAELHSPHQTAGEELSLDHVHPTIETHRQLALMLLDALNQEGSLEMADTWNQSAIASIKAEVEGRLDQNAHAAALRNLAKVMGWAGKFEEARRLAERACDLTRYQDTACVETLAAAYEAAGKGERAKHLRSASAGEETQE